MAAKNIGILILEGRTAKKLSQTALANAVGGGLSGSDIGKAERGEKELTQAQLKAIAKVLGVTQKSLLEAKKGGTATAAAKTTAAKTTAAKTTAAKTTAAKKTTAAGTAKTTAAKTTTAAKKTTAAAKTTAEKKTSTAASALTPTEKKLIEMYRAADSDSKKLATRILKGEKLELGDLLPMMMSGDGGGENPLGGLLGKLQGLMK